jgi:hypothetical protein
MSMSTMLLWAPKVTAKRIRTAIASLTVSLKSGNRSQMHQPRKISDSIIRLRSIRVRAAMTATIAVGKSFVVTVVEIAAVADAGAVVVVAAGEGARKVAAIFRPRNMPRRKAISARTILAAATIPVVPSKAVVSSRGSIAARKGRASARLPRRQVLQKTRSCCQVNPLQNTATSRQPLLLPLL